MSCNKGAMEYHERAVANEAASADAVTDEEAVREPITGDAGADEKVVREPVTGDAAQIDDSVDEEIPEVRILSEAEYEALSEEKRTEYVLSISARILKKYRKAFEELAK